MVESDHSEAGQDVTSNKATRKIEAADKVTEVSSKRPREGCQEDDKVELPNKKSRSEMDEQSSTAKDESAAVPESNGTTMVVDEEKNSQGNGDAKLNPTEDAENRESADNASSADMETQEESQEEKTDDEKQEIETNQDAPDSAAKEDKAKPMEQDEAEDKVIHEHLYYIDGFFLILKQQS